MAQWSLYVKKIKKELEAPIEQMFSCCFCVFFGDVIKPVAGLGFLVVNTISPQGFSHRFLHGFVLWLFQKL